ncbi:MAG: M23 family metallopeptidase [Desulfobulbaceae bacterium]|jgi:murein DD-endopeptidase MepM/ murein hydrolase activator NlpD|nr:M23 family metallopeptidase [Desulfobulbaceae bacterium]
MQKHYYFLFTSDDGSVWRWSCRRKRLIQGAAVIGVFFCLFTVLAVRSAALGAHSLALEARLADSERRIAAKDVELAAQKRLDQERNERLTGEVAALTREKNGAVASAVRELSERSALIDEMLAKIGFTMAVASTDDVAVGSGGPFLVPRSQTDELLSRADHYLATVSRLPLGLPAQGSLASPFGNRIDPLNRRRAFHAGMDFRGGQGGKVFATADGVVKEARWNGSFGRYVEIDHENGYSTAYAHLSKFTVKVGSRVERGQLIGSIGSSGRSTGPHLHYELRYRGNPINPNTYARIEEIIRVGKQKIRKR